jgi:putative peptidoglycan lipid II flippase
MEAFAAELEACLAHPGANGTGPGDDTLVVTPAPAPAPEPAKRRRRATRPPAERPSVWPLILLLAGLAVLAAIFAIVFAFTGSPTGFKQAFGGGKSHHKAAVKVVHLRGVSGYDPYGTGGEHDTEAGNATDGSASTYWETEHYNSSLAAIGKRGVGLLLDAGSARKLSQVTVTSDTPGFTAVIESGPGQNGPFRRVSSSQTVGSRTTFTVSGAAARYYVVWITDLGSNSSVHLNEVTAKG